MIGVKRIVQKTHGRTEHWHWQYSVCRPSRQRHAVPASHRPQPARRSLVALVHRWSIDGRLFRIVRVLLDCTLSSALTDANTVAPVTPAVLSDRVSCSSWAQDNPYRRSRTSSRCPAVASGTRSLQLYRGAQGWGRTNGMQVYGPYGLKYCTIEVAPNL